MDDFKGILWFTGLKNYLIFFSRKGWRSKLFAVAIGFVTEDYGKIRIYGEILIRKVLAKKKMKKYTN